MGRPRNDQDPAAARLEAAFFDELQRSPYQRITVSAIVQAAGVNRNSFYYHYADLDDLAHSAVQHLLIPEIPRLLVSGFGPESEQFDRLIATVIDDDRLRRLLVIIGPNSTSELRGILQEAVIGIWLGVLDLDQEALGAQELATIRFMLGGILELLSRIEPVDPADGAGSRGLLPGLEAMRRLPILQTSARILMETLTGLAARRGTAGAVETGNAAVGDAGLEPTTPSV